jgi:hypothetical protein
LSTNILFTKPPPESLFAESGKPHLWMGQLIWSLHSAKARVHYQCYVHLTFIENHKWLKRQLELIHWHTKN